VIGVVCSVTASLSFTPAALALLRPRPQGRSLPMFGWSFDRLAERVARFDLANRRAIFVGAFAVFLIAIYGASQIRTGTQQVSKFRPNAPVRVHFEKINEHLEGANLLFVVLETGDPDGFKEPVYLKQIEELQGWLDEQPEVGGTTSLVDYLKLINRAFNSDDPEFATIPPSRRAVAQLLFFGGGEELRPVVDRGFQTAIVRVRAHVIDSDDVMVLTNRIESRLAELPGPLTTYVTGTAVVLNRSLDRIIIGQAQSVVAALAIIYVILSILFFSPRVGAIALIPNVLPVAVYFGALGLTGMRLHSGTSLIAPMVLGIAVDDTIHYFARFIRDSRRLGDEQRATVSALKSVGRPVTYTTAGLCLGFMTLNFSQLGLAAEVGSMAAFALGFAWLTDFVLTPALCARMRIATLWDFLLLDLGRDPQHSLQLLRGLRASQARIVALMGRMLDLPAGRRLYDAGDPGDALYMVVNGRLRETIAIAGGSRELGQRERGEVLGESGLFHARRISTVDVLEPTRLLRISDRSLEHLGRRYPRIASIVFRNLNALLARSMVAATVGLDAGADARQPSEALAVRGRALEQAFFQRQASAQRARLVQRADGLAAAPGEPAGGGPERSLDGALSGVALRADIAAALLLTPLVEVAWADGQIDAAERRELLRAAEAHGISAGSASFELLRIWLDERPGPDLMQAWSAFTIALCAELSVEARMRLADAVLGHARDVAAAAGGLLGLAAISRSEERALAELARAVE
jgi:CRP-like cAMP-binding protein